MRDYLKSITPKSYKRLFRISAFVLLPLLYSCTDEFDLNLDKKEQKLVVEGWVTDKPGPYLVRLTKSEPGLGNQREENFWANVEAVKDALIIISDNAGTVDTLRPRQSQNWHDDYFTIQNGYYETTKLQGKAGRTYFLKVETKGQEYIAASYMAPVTAIEEMSFVEKKNPFKKNETQMVPVISFYEPQDTRDYYLFSTDSYYPGNVDEWQPFYFGGSNRHWNVSILSDELLPAYVQDYIIDDGASPSGMDFYYFFAPGDEVRINMHSLSKEAYEYYKALISQFNNDGGAFKPAPASPPTNISNGAVGFFGASAVSYIEGKVE